MVDDRLSVAVALRRLSAGETLLWNGDYHNARQLLQGLQRRLQSRKGSSAESHPTQDLTSAFHRTRMQMAQEATLLNRVLLPYEPGYVISLRRAPEVSDAMIAAWGPSEQAGLVSLRELLGIIGAWQWRVRGVPIAALQGAKIHPHYGVFAPLRQEYLNLLAQEPLPAECHTAFDVGTGTGVLALILAQRGIPEVFATDSSSAAVACAQDNVARLGRQNVVQVRTADLWPGATPADLIVCNPPWLPGKVRTALDAAVYDPDSQMLQRFLREVRIHLRPQGQAWLILSDLAERLGLRNRETWLAWATEGGLELLGHSDAQPLHRRAHDLDDPLAQARGAEIISLWRFAAAA